MPWPDLGTHRNLVALLRLPSKNWGSPVITTVVNTVWKQHFLRIHLMRFFMFGLEVVCFIAWAMLLEDEHASKSLDALARHPGGLAAVLLGICSMTFACAFLYLEYRHHARSVFGSRVRQSEGAIVRVEGRPAETTSTDEVTQAIEIALAELLPHSPMRKLWKRLVLDPWNLCDVVSQLLVFSCTIAFLARASHDALVSWTAITTISLLMKTLGFFRGIAGIDWLVQVLQQNLQDMCGFLVLVATIILCESCPCLLCLRFSQPLTKRTCVLAPRLRCGISAALLLWVRQRCGVGRRHRAGPRLLLACSLDGIQHGPL